MVKKTEPKKFGVVALIITEVNIDIEANSLEDAVAKSQEIKPEQFITLEGEEFSFNHQIVQVWDRNPKLER